MKAIFWAALMALLVSCAPPSLVQPTPLPQAEPTAAPSGEEATPAPPTAAPAVEAPTATPLPAAESTTDFAALVRADFLSSLGAPLAAPNSAQPGISDVAVFELVRNEGQPRTWAAHTVGMRNFETEQAHQVAVYEQSGPDGITQTARAVLANEADNPDSLAPDYLGEGGVSRQLIEPSSLWLSVEGGVGAHSGVYGLLRLEGNTLLQEVTAFSSAPGPAYSRDLTGDGISEVITDSTDYYVFCYACGVRLPQYNVWRWNGESMVQVTLAELPADVSQKAQAANAHLLALAGGGLWRDVLESLDEAQPLAAEDPSGVFGWNLTLLRLNAEARRAQTEQENAAYPLLDRVFYGDYEGAVEIMRAYPPEEIFSLRSPLIVGGVAEGWEETLASWLHRSSADALAALPDLAAAHFISGWADFLVGNRDEAVLSVQRAAELVPDDPLYRDSAQLGAQNSAVTAMLTALVELNIRSGPGTSFAPIGSLSPGAVVEVTGQFGEGADHWWQIAWNAPDAAARSEGWVLADPRYVTVENGEEVAPVAAVAVVGDVAARGRIFYSQEDRAGMSAIYSVDVVAGAEPLLVISEARLPALRPQGDLLAFASTRTDMLGLGGVDLRSGERLRYSFNVEDALPRWNAQGDRLIFSSTREGDRRPRIYRIWADGAGTAEVVRQGQDADWFAADERIVFKGCDETGSACGLWTLRGDGTEAVPLTDVAGDSRPRWLPGGDAVLFMSDQRDGNWELYRVNLATGEVTRLTDDPALDGLPAPNPEGSAIAFVTNRSGAWELVTIPVQGGPVTVIHRLGDDYPNWLEHGLDWKN